MIFATDTYPMNPKFESWLEYFNMVFFYIFSLEMIIRMLGVGLKIYFHDVFSVFDFVVVMLSVLELILTQVLDEI